MLEQGFKIVQPFRFSFLNEHRLFGLSHLRCPLPTRKHQQKSSPGANLFLKVKQKNNTHIYTTVYTRNFYQI